MKIMVFGARFVRGGLAVLLCCSAFEACSASESPGFPDPSRGGSGGGSGIGFAGEAGARVIIPNFPASGGTSGTANPACGIRLCVPDDVMACSSAERRIPRQLELNGGAGGSNDGGGAAGANSGGADAGAGGSVEGGGGADSAGRSNSGGALSTAGTFGNGGVFGLGGLSGSLPEGGAAGASSSGFACRVIAEDEEPVASCEVAGSGKLNAPCFSGSDCAAGFACVQAGLAGVCRPYCCEGESSCTQSSPDKLYPNTYCTERPLLGDSPSDVTLSVPVCMTAERCDLREPFPCPEGATCQCSGERACMVVGASGITACVVPGVGAPGEACPCQYGSVCAEATSTCVKLCLLGRTEGELSCGKGRCQESTQLPAGFGVCVGG